MITVILNLSLVAVKQQAVDFTFFKSWQDLLTTILNTVLAYAALVLFLRVAGKRSLSKMNAFDFIVTVALGSCLATVALSKTVLLSDGLAAFFLLLSLQACLTWLSARSKRVKNLITSKPVMLVYRGEMLYKVLKEERISEEELWMAARKSGLGYTTDIDVAILETTGEITIIASIDAVNAETLQDVERPAMKKP